ncbi:hypothetical protein DPSP01_006105 [Paraphaeosphaeria sporulosa]|uniref:Alpha/beta-hydrolase n=1 Tax=Paraphaeosphaeria sporulosa TaxID=1460663 RepID=A0A177BVS2_9PLEO|nr:uncharacterized protein CC84DRAFT_426518 [Paraphaeosphaeria sporulosa]OAF98831.1 hypothetical protein CC84DRAFT_426518 [Paraphaeosphaeria sporulosa]
MYGFAFASLVALAACAPQRGGRQRATAQQQAAQIPQGISQATDGSMILDATVNINQLPIRFKIAAPADQFTAASGVPGAAAASGANGTMGVNVLLHGDGGQSFFDFPNQNLQANTMGVALLAPNANLFWGGGSGLDRTDGVAHAQAVSDFVTKAMPQLVAFDAANVKFTGVSGGSLLMSGFFIPAQMQNFANSAVELNCGAMPPQVNFANAAAVMSTLRIHYQSTQSELTLLQDAIPQAVVAYEQLAANAGLGAAQINALQTVDNTPAGGHCEFDGKDFVSGVQTMLTSFSNVVQGGDGVVAGLGAPSNGNVLTGVVGNEKLQFAAGRRKRGVESMVVKRWAEALVPKPRRRRQDVVVEEEGVAMLACDRMRCN